MSVCSDTPRSQGEAVSTGQLSSPNPACYPETDSNSDSDSDSDSASDSCRTSTSFTCLLSTERQRWS